MAEPSNPFDISLLRDRLRAPQLDPRGTGVVSEGEAYSRPLQQWEKPTIRDFRGENRAVYDYQIRGIQDSRPSAADKGLAVSRDVLQLKPQNRISPKINGANLDLQLKLRNEISNTLTVNPKSQLKAQNFFNMLTNTRYLPPDFTRNVKLSKDRKSIEFSSERTRLPGREWQDDLTKITRDWELTSGVLEISIDQRGGILGQKLRDDLAAEGFDGGEGEYDEERGHLLVLPASEKNQKPTEVVKPAVFDNPSFALKGSGGTPTIERQDPLELGLILGLTTPNKKLYAENVSVSDYDVRKEMVKLNSGRGLITIATGVVVKIVAPDTKMEQRFPVIPVPENIMTSKAVHELSVHASRFSLGEPAHHNTRLVERNADQIDSMLASKVAADERALLGKVSQMIENARRFATQKLKNRQ